MDISLNYGYFIETKKQIKEGDFICIGYCTKDGHQNGINEDRNIISVVRVMKVVDDYDHNVEKGNELIAPLSKPPIYKEFIGKADLSGYFAEIDRKRKIEEINYQLEQRFRWNKKTYEVLEIENGKVTLKSEDGSVFTIVQKEYITNYIKNNA